MLGSFFVFFLHNCESNLCFSWLDWTLSRVWCCSLLITFLKKGYIVICVFWHASVCSCLHLCLRIASSRSNSLSFPFCSPVLGNCCWFPHVSSIPMVTTVRSSWSTNQCEAKVLSASTWGNLVIHVVFHAMCFWVWISGSELVLASYFRERANDRVQCCKTQCHPAHYPVVRRDQLKWQLS